MTKKRKRFRSGRNGSRSGRADKNNTSSSHADQKYDYENRSILFSRKSSKGQGESETRMGSLQPGFTSHDRRETRGRDSQEHEIYVIDDVLSSPHDSERRYSEDGERAHTENQRTDNISVPERMQRVLFEERIARRSSGSLGSPVPEIIHLDGGNPGSIGTHVVVGLRDSPSPDQVRGESFGQGRNRSSEFDEILAQRKKELGAEATTAFRGRTQLRDHPSASEIFQSGTNQPRKGATGSPRRARIEDMSRDAVWEPRERRDSYFGRSSSLESKSTPQPAQQCGWASPAARYNLQDPRSRPPMPELSRNSPSLPPQPTTPPPAPSHPPSTQLPARPLQESSPSTRRATTDARLVGAGSVRRNCEEGQLPETKKPRVATPEERDGTRSNAVRKQSSSASALKQRKLTNPGPHLPRNHAGASRQSNQTMFEPRKQSPTSTGKKKTNASTPADLRTSLRGQASSNNKARKTVVELIAFFNQVLSHDECEARANRDRIERAEDQLKEAKASLAELDQRTRQNKRRLEGFRRILRQIPLAGSGQGDVEVLQKSRKRERERRKDVQPVTLSKTVESGRKPSDSMIVARQKEGDMKAGAGAGVGAGAGASGENQRNRVMANAGRPSSNLLANKRDERAVDHQSEELALVLPLATLPVNPVTATVVGRSVQDMGTNETIDSGVDEGEVPVVQEECEKVLDMNSLVSPNSVVKGAASAVDRAAAPDIEAVRLEHNQPLESPRNDTGQPTAEEETERGRAQKNPEPQDQRTAIPAETVEPEDQDAEGPEEVIRRASSALADGIGSKDFSEGGALPKTEQTASPSHAVPIEGARTAEPQRGVGTGTQEPTVALVDHLSLGKDSRPPQVKRPLEDPEDQMRTAGRQGPAATTGGPSAAGATSIDFPNALADIKGSVCTGENLPSSFDAGAETPGGAFASSFIGSASSLVQRSTHEPRVSTNDVIASQRGSSTNKPEAMSSSVTDIPARKSPQYQQRVPGSGQVPPTVEPNGNSNQAERPVSFICGEEVPEGGRGREKCSEAKRSDSKGITAQASYASARPQSSELTEQAMVIGSAEEAKLAESLVAAVPVTPSTADPRPAQLTDHSGTTVPRAAAAPADCTQKPFSRQSDNGWWIRSSRARRLRAFVEDRLRMDRLCYNFIDPQRALCPWELHGKCQSRSCEYQHFHSFTATPVEVLDEVLCYCPDGSYKLTSVRLKRRYLSGEEMPKLLKEALAVCGFTDAKIPERRRKKAS